MDPVFVAGGILDDVRIPNQDERSSARLPQSRSSHPFRIQIPRAKSLDRTSLALSRFLLVTFGVLSAALWTTEWYAVFLPLPFIMLVFLTGFEVMGSLAAGPGQDEV